MTSIGVTAFVGCSDLTSVTIPDSVTSIGESAFSNCENLTTAIIPDSVTSIGDRAFISCSDLTSVTIPDSVTSIGEGAFSGCKRLTTVTILGSLTSIGEAAFKECKSLTTVTISGSVTSIGAGAFTGCKNLTDVTIPDSVKSIGEGAFDGCTSLTYVAIPDSVTSIGGGAFNGCTSLSSVTLPNSVTSIGEGAFSGCTSLTNITIPDSATSVGANAFRFCTSLTSVTIPDSMTSIGEGAFYGCTSLTDATLPNSVTSIGEGAFVYNGGDNQKFMLTKNADGSYKLRTKITNGKSAVEIANAGTGSGDNVQQWEINGANCQDWILEAVANPGCKMDTNVSYEFENVNSGMVMDIEAGKMEDGTNVQQWTTGHFNSQKWVLEAFSGGGNYYYIRSFADQGYVLRAASGSNGGNLEIAPYSTKDSAMLFKFSKQPDGSYTILTRASKDGCLLEIPNAGIVSGNNVAQWEPTGHVCQRWNAVTEALSEPTEPTTEAKPEPTTEAPTQASTEVSTEAPTAAPTETTSEQPTFLRGDADENGMVELLDIVKLQRYLLAVDTLNAQQAENADMNEDGVVDIFDLALLKRLVVQG